MPRLQYDDYGWLAVLGVVAVVEGGAPPGKMLSHAAARYRATQPWLAIPFIVYLAAHLLGCWPTRFDVLSQIARACGKDKPHDVI